MLQGECILFFCLGKNHNAFLRCYWKSLYWEELVENMPFWGTLTEHIGNKNFTSFIFCSLFDKASLKWLHVHLVWQPVQYSCYGISTEWMHLHVFTVLNNHALSEMDPTTWYARFLIRYTGAALSPVHFTFLCLYYFMSACFSDVRDPLANIGRSARDWPLIWLSIWFWRSFMEIFDHFEIQYWLAEGMVELMSWVLYHALIFLRLWK